MSLPRILRNTACTLIVITSLSVAPQARAGSGREIAAAGYFLLAGLQVPAVAFEFVAYGRLNGALDGWMLDEDFADTAHSVATCNLVGGILHTTKFLAWSAGGVALMTDTELFPLAMVALNGGLDMANAILGITAGAMILGARDNVEGLAGSDLNKAATMSGVVHVVFGAISAIVTLPELMVGIFGIVAMAELERDRPDVRVAFSPTGLTVYGRF